MNFFFLSQRMNKIFALYSVSIRGAGFFLDWRGFFFAGVYFRRFFFSVNKQWKLWDHESTYALPCLRFSSRRHS